MDDLINDGGGILRVFVFPDPDHRPSRVTEQTVGFGVT